MILPRVLLIVTYVVTVLGLYVPDGFSSQELNAEENSDTFSLEWQDVLEEVLSTDQVQLLDEIHLQVDNKLHRRDLESGLESIIDLLNSSGLIWDALDYAADHDNIIEFLGNTIGGFLNSSGDMDMETTNTTAILSFLSGTVQSLNVSALGSVVVDSGLVQSVLDGLLLDDDFRPVLAGLVYNITEHNMGLIALVVQNLLAPANGNSKRDFTGTLIEFVGNFVGSFLNSKVFYSGLGDVLNALNDTGFVVYTIQRFLSTPAYINMTGKLVSDTVDASGFSLMDLSDFSLSDLPINITEIVASVLSDSSSIAKIVGNVLLGDYSGLSDFLKRYIPGIKALILELQDMGLFNDLNENLFPDAKNNNKEMVNKNVTSVQTEENKAYSSPLNVLSVIIPFMTIVYFI